MINHSEWTTQDEIDSAKAQADELRERAHALADLVFTAMEEMANEPDRSKWDTDNVAIAADKLAKTMREIDKELYYVDRLSEEPDYDSIAKQQRTDKGAA